MAYTPTLWAKGDIVTSEKLNKIEQGIVDKVDKVNGKTLSTNDYTNEDKAKLNGLESQIDHLESLVGSPLVASTAADMTDEDKVYVYTGSETGYQSGNWYYYNGTTWTSGGVYNSVAFETDDTLSTQGMAADAKKTGDELLDLKEDLNSIAAENVTQEEITSYDENEGFMYASGAIAAVSTWHYYKFPVNPKEEYVVTSYCGQSGRLWLVLDVNDNVLDYSEDTSAQSQKTESVIVPTNGAYMVINCVYSHKNDMHIFLVEKEYTINNEKIIINGIGIDAYFTRKEYPVALIKSGNNIQVQSEFDGQLLAIACTTNGSRNGGFSFSHIYTADLPKINNHELVTDTLYKSCNDDITPIHYNGSYRGANHGKFPTFAVTKPNHGYTENDIGDTWEEQYIIVRIDDSNNFTVIGDVNGSKNDVVTTPPTPLDATISSVQLIPTFKNYAFTMRNDNGDVLSDDGVLLGDKIIFDESYELIDIVDMVNYLKSHIGNNTNATYYSNAVKSEMAIHNTFIFEDSGMCLIATNAVPLKQNIWVEYYGGVQSSAIGNTVYAPFTTVDDLTEMGTTTINLTKSSWRDETFPPYKMYQFDQNKGFVTGYIIDYGQGLPNIRADKINGANGAGFWYISSKKMYPHFYDYALSSAPDLYGSALSFYCYRAPVTKKNNVCTTWYEVHRDIYCEFELFESKNYILELPVKCHGRRIEIIKKTESLNILVDVSSGGALRIFASDKGSATIRFY